MTSATMTVRLNDQLKGRLDKLAGLTHRSKSFLAAEAISAYIKIQEWQINEIKKGIAEADSGQLVDHRNIVEYWEKKRAHTVDKKRSKKFKAS
jgi:predicted transcriptional regulator